MRTPEPTTWPHPSAQVWGICVTLVSSPRLLPQSLGRSSPPQQACAAYLSTNRPACSKAVYMGSAAQQWKLITLPGNRNTYLIRPAIVSPFCPWRVSARLLAGSGHGVLLWGRGSGSSAFLVLQMLSTCGRHLGWPVSCGRSP